MDTHARGRPVSYERSSSLAELAARIRVEHEASGVALKEGLRHAIAAGELLIEAKAQLSTASGHRGSPSIARSQSEPPKPTCVWRAR
jgi:hypothetical protein